MMHDDRDILGGALLMLAGGFMVWHASATLDFGTVRRMGPGMFPVSVGALLAGFGLAILVTAFFRSGRIPTVEWRSASAILGAISVFALMIGPFGLIPAIFGLVVVSSLAEIRFRPVAMAALCIFLPAIAYLIFRIGLGLPLSMARFPI